MAEGTNLTDVAAQVREATETLRSRRRLREQNLAPQRPPEDALKKLDSSMKRNTALIRKLKQLNEESCKAILTDISKTNQSKYVTEAVSAVAEAPFKAKDVPAALQICSALHQRYADFAKELIPMLAEAASGAGSSGTDGEKLTPARRRSLLRLLIELLLCGLYASHTVLLHTLKQLTTVDFKRDLEDALLSLSLVATVAKSGREALFGLHPADPAPLPADLDERVAAGDCDAVKLSEAVVEYRAELSLRWIAPEEVQASFRAAVDRLFKSACDALSAAYQSLEARDLANQRILNTRGDLPERLAEKYEAQRADVEALQRGAGALAEALDQSLPNLKLAATRVDESSSQTDVSAMTADTSNALFEDEETRAFYESLPNLRDIVPAVLLGESSTTKETDKASGENESAQPGGNQINADAERLQNAVENLTLHRDGEGGQAQAVADTVARDDNEDGGITIGEEERAEGVILGEGEQGENEGDLDELEVDIDMEVEGDEEGEEEEGPRRGALDAVLARLPECVSKDLCDQVAVDFCYAGGAGKRARKRMAKALCAVPPGSLQLLPHYARVAAILHAVFPDITTTLVASLQGLHRGLVKKKDATTRTLEPRVRNATYVAELVKFQVFPAGTAFLMLKSMLDDFSGHNVDAACAFIECCGRYLSRRPDTATRMNNMLDIGMKLKNAKNLDARHVGLVDAAYAAVRATARGPKKKERSPQQEFVRYLMYDRLDATSVPFVLKKLRRLQWKEEGPYVFRVALRVARKGRDSQLAPLAGLIAALSVFHPWLGVSVVDAVLEEISAGLDAPEAALYQRRVSAVRFLAHLYSQRLASAPVIFGLMHALLAHAHTPETPPEVSQRLDPPGNYFRIRLICALLDAVGPSVARGGQRRRLDEFLPYFQRYVLSKPPLPLDVELDVQDVFVRLNITPPAYESYEAACAAVAAAEAKQADAAAAGLQAIEEEEEEEEEERDAESGSSEADSIHVGDDVEALYSGCEGSDTSEDGDGDASDSSSDGSGSSSSSSSSSSTSSDEAEEDALDRARRLERVEADQAFDREMLAMMGASESRALASSVAMVGAGAAAGATASSGLVATSSMSSSLAKGIDGGSCGSKATASNVPTETMALRVMLKRGGRADKSKEVNIPVPTTVAQRLRAKEAEEAAERAELKRMVLASNMQAEEEERAAVAAAAALAAHQGRRAKGYYARGGGRTGTRHDNIN